MYHKKLKVSSEKNGLAFYLIIYNLVKMIKKSINLILCGMFFLLFIGCEKIFFNPSFKSKDFPFSVENYWIYQRVDSLNNNNIDTVELKVVAQNISIADQENLWLVTWNNKDTQFVDYKDNMIAFYNYNANLNSLIVNMQFNFPFEENDEWDLDYKKGTYTVKQKDFESNQLGLNYGNCYQLNRIAREDSGYQLEEKIYVKEKIGIIYQHLLEKDPVLVKNQVMRLIDHNVD